MTTFTIGADPEIFVKANGKPISAHDLIKGTKKEPFPVPGGAYQVDGLATEFNINPIPVHSPDGFNSGIVSVMKQLHAAVKESNPAASFMKQTTVDFDPDYLAELPKDVLVLGCDPDWNAYTEQPNPAPDGTVNFRATGGHVHLGWTTDMPVDDPEYIAICADIVKVLDLFLGVPCRILDLDDRRRTMYGKAGSFRPKPYGLEYRTPSSIWIHQKATRIAVAESVRQAVSSLNSWKTSEKLFQYFSLTEEDVRNGIDGDIACAEALRKKMWYAWHFPQLLLTKALEERKK